MKYQEKRKLQLKQKVETFINQHNLKLYKNENLTEIPTEYSIRIPIYHQCPNCGKVLKKLINNLLKGSIHCRSCGGKNSHTPEAQVKYKVTMLKKYGVDNPNKSKEIRAKTEKTNKERYGEKGSIGVARKAFQEKYGTDNPYKVKEIRDKIKETNIQKYGVDHFNKLLNNRNNLKEKMESKIGHASILRTQLLSNNNCQDYEELGKKVISFLENNNLPANSKEAIKQFKCCGQTLISILRSQNREDLIKDNFKISNKETQIKNYIKSIYSGKIIENDRTILGGKELDIYLPELKIAFEFNGLIWHSEKYNKNKNYHYDKYRKCLEKGINLYTIFEHEYDLFKEKLFAFIKKLIVKSPIIYARECDVSFDYSRIRKFIEINHLQGFKNSGFWVGLIYENEIVAAITIGNHHRNEKELVLNRVCFSKYRIIGGLEKLLCHMFLRFSKIEKIITWSDNRYSPTGNMYKNAKFEFVKDLKPDYFYTDGNSYISKQSQKKKNTGCPSDLTESQWSTKLGLYKIWDCGKKKWQIKREGF